MLFGFFCSCWMFFYWWLLIWCFTSCEQILLASFLLHWRAVPVAWHGRSALQTAFSFLLGALLPGFPFRSASSLGGLTPSTHSCCLSLVALPVLGTCAGLPPRVCRLCPLPVVVFAWTLCSTAVHPGPFAFLSLGFGALLET